MIPSVMDRSSRTLGHLALFALLAGCSTGEVIPPSLQASIDTTVTFQQLRDSPQAHQGRLVVLGGEVLAARRLQDGTRLEVLQLPLDRSLRPEPDRMASLGRFFAVHKEFLDPATLPPGTRLTVVGEVSGATTDKIDDIDYTFLVVEIKSLKVWPQMEFFSPSPFPSPTVPPFYWYPSLLGSERIRR